MSPSVFNAKGKTAIITGGGRGIGAATAKLFASEGAHVVMAARTVFEIKDIENQIRRDRGDALAIATDVSQEESVKNLFEKTKQEFGPVDILINNAGVLSLREITAMTLAEWKQILDINLTGSFLCGREAMGHMKNAGKGGVIINVSSISGLRGWEKFPGMAAYVASKFGLVGLTEVLAVEGKPFGIRANCIAPGAVATRMLEQSAPGFKAGATPEDIARFILSLCEGDVTGSVLEIDCNG